MPYRLRAAQQADAAALLGIYAPYVTDSCISFETDVPSVGEFERRIRTALERAAYLVAEDAVTGDAVGYAYNGVFRTRPAFAWASETSIYLDPQHRGRGLGFALLDTLEELMRLQGIRMAEACITSTNEASIAFHEHHGYRICGQHTACGYKLGQWLSVTWMEKQLLPLDPAPRPPHGLATADVEAVLAAANSRFAANRGPLAG